MKKIILRLFLVIFSVIGASFCAFLGYLYFPNNQHFDRTKLEKNNYSITFYDNENKQINFATNYLGSRVKVEELPDYLKKAFIAVEDKRFYTHHGVDYRGVLRAIKNNFSSGGIKEGGSTITQQLIKNTHLTSERTFKRKIKEMKLAIALEREYSKEQILEFYLNGVYFGEGVYGIQCAAQKYFGVEASNLSLAQACALAATVKAPSVYNPKEPKCEDRKNLVLQLMHEQGYLSKEDFNNAKNEKILTIEFRKDFYLRGALQEVYQILNISPYQEQKIEVYTYYNSHAQSSIESTLPDFNQSAVIMGKTGEIKAYKMPQGNYERSIGSTIKPLLVYAPAIDMGEIHLMSKILDERCSFGDYSPQNYANKYYGYISAKEALSLSLNIPAVKILDSIGTQKARLYVDKLGIHINEEGLNIALGSYNGGVKLTTLCSAYNVFLNEGENYSPTFIKQIKKGGKSVYERQITGKKVYKSGTCELINQALSDCAITGSAKAIGKRDFEVCAKTGTVGKANGNSDAYTVCYTSSDIIGIRFSESDKLLANSVTGGMVAKYAGEILSDLYKDYQPENFKSSGELTNIKACLQSYEDGKIMKAHPNQPARYTFDCPILSSEEYKILQSDFFNPTTVCEIKVENFNAEIITAKKNYVCLEIWRKKDNEDYVLIYDGKDDTFKDEELYDGNYLYRVSPYVIDNEGNKIYCEPLDLKKVRIDRDDNIKNKDWWNGD